MKKLILCVTLLAISVPSTASACRIHPLRTAARVFWRTSPFYVFGHHGCHK